MKRTILYLAVIIIISILFACTEEAPVSPVIDHIAPFVEWVDPESGSELSGTVELVFSVYDENSIDRISVYRNGSQFGWGGLSSLPEDQNISATDDTLYTLEWNTIYVEDGVHILEARAWDVSGNAGVSPALLLRVKNNTDPPPEDRTPPVVTWLSPEPGSTVEGLVELRFQVMDDVGLDSVKVYLNGQELQNLTNMEEFFDANVIWITSDYPDGDYIVEVRAWDSSGNMGSAPGVTLSVLNHPPREPRVLWVPDDFETIQDAINASEDGDTVRVRTGIYRESIWFYGKAIWLESEEGPEVTFINGIGWNDGVRVAYGEDYRYTVVRGFTISGDATGVQVRTLSGVTLYNCIFRSLPGDYREISGVAFMSVTFGVIYNCIFINCSRGVGEDYISGLVENSVFTQCRLGYHKIAINETHFTHGWNLFWNNERDYRNTEPAESDLFTDPRFVHGSYRLAEDSPAIDAGNPDILDLDGSRSDIGVHGGPYSYPNQNNGG